MEYLQPIYDARKSFYGKAKYQKLAASVILESYDTRIVEVFINSTMQIYPAFYSMTTMHHVKEFLKQLGVNIERTLKNNGYKTLKQLLERETNVRVVIDGNCQL